MWYADGSIQVAANGNVAVGTGTLFLANVRVGDAISIAGSTALHEITGVASNTQLTFQPPYAGPAGSGKAYRVAPILGYDKDLSDAINAWRRLYGDRMAAMQPWSYAATPAAARQGLELNSAALRQALGTSGPLYSRDSILGTVSQSSGVPAGAIIERGSNANGEYVRFADGTQWCWFRRTDSSVAILTPFFGGFRAGSIVWAYPAAFSAPPTVMPNADTVTAFGVGVVTPSTLSVNYCYTAVASQSATNRDVSLLASGRWYN